jgi:hypothetical protein
MSEVLEKWELPEVRTIFTRQPILHTRRYMNLAGSGQVLKRSVASSYIFCVAFLRRKNSRLCVCGLAGVSFCISWTRTFGLVMPITACPISYVS